MRRRRPRNYTLSGVPLGGIGAGKVELRPNGSFSNITTNNNWEMPICDGTARREAVANEEGVPGAFFAAWVEGEGAKVLRTESRAGLPTLSLDAIEYRGRFPVAEMEFDLGSAIKVELEAFSPLILDDPPESRYRDSAVPGAIFRFRVRNAGRTARRAALAFSWENLTGRGGYAGREINDVGWFELRAQAVSGENGGRLAGVRMSCGSTAADPRVQGEHALGVVGARGQQLTCAPSGGGDGAPSWWAGFERGGELPEADGSDAEGAGIFCKTSAVASKMRLRAGETKEVVFVLSWYFPHLIAAGNPKVDYGHAYQNWFGDAWDVAGYLAEHRERLRAGVARWQQALGKSNLPDWLIDKLTNDLFPVFANTWYTKDFRQTVNESPTFMQGCAGTIDQRSGSNAVYTMTLPGLSRSELSLFSEQQVRGSDPYGQGTHWNPKSGRFDLTVNRDGAIRHDVGWDDLEGGRLGRIDWLTSHWPDLTAVYVLQVYQYVAWTGDREFLDYAYPRVKRAMAFHERLDLDGDGVADLWGAGSNTFDNEGFPYYGASSFIASLYLAACEAGRRLGELKGDPDFARRCERGAGKARSTMEEVLWDGRRGHYLNWVDRGYRNWSGGPRKHAPRSTTCFIAQLAGQWFANLLGLPPIVDRRRIRRALGTIFKRNVGVVSGSPALEVGERGKHTLSWAPYVQIYYAANALYEGRAHEGMEALRKIYRVGYQVDGSPWNQPLGWTGPENDVFEWGRWYMTYPCTWFMLPAIGGVVLDLMAGTLGIAPNVPKGVGGGRKLERLPIFMPRFWGSIDYAESRGEARIRFRVTRMIGSEPIRLARFASRLPEGRKASELRSARLAINGKRASVEPEVDGRTGAITFEAPYEIGAEGDGILCVLRFAR